MATIENQTPIIDSPLGIRITRLYQDMDDCWDREAKALKAAIHRLTGYSAHADQQNLCDWVKSMPEPPGEIRLVHGEPEAQRTLKSKLDLLF
jgi:predicted metal-dependent RNase